MDYIFLFRWHVVFRYFFTALLSGTLQTYQKAACDEEWVNIRCPTGTTISIQLAQYGKTAPAASLCRSSNPNIFPDLMDPVHANSNFTCLWPAAIQVFSLWAKYSIKHFPFQLLLFSKSTYSKTFVFRNLKFSIYVCVYQHSHRFWFKMLSQLNTCEIHGWYLLLIELISIQNCIVFLTLSCYLLCTVTVPPHCTTINLFGAVWSFADCGGIVPEKT